MSVSLEQGAAIIADLKESVERHTGEPPIGVVVIIMDQNSECRTFAGSQDRNFPMTELLRQAYDNNRRAIASKTQVIVPQMR